MRYVLFLIGLCLSSLSALFSSEAGDLHPTPKIAIVGGGIIGALESYYAHLEALEQGTEARIVVYEKGSSFAKTNTAFNIFPSFTVDEILSVVPRGSELVEKLAIPFSEPGGIRVDDVPGVNDSEAAIRFKEAVVLYGKDKNHDDRTKTLLMLGKMSMDLWQDLYAHADEELKGILEESNYNPCHDPKNRDKRALHDGYRIDLLYGIPDAEERARNMQATYAQLGYEYCQLLSPHEVMVMDPSLTDFCTEHSGSEDTWNRDCAALWRPGGCISTRVFLPKFYEYLKRVMGTYVDASGHMQECFSLEFDKEVTGVAYDVASDVRVVGLRFSDGSLEQDANTRYVFCPGEAVGTLHKFGFDEPAYAGFAGASLFLDIPLSLSLSLSN